MHYAGHFRAYEGLPLAARIERDDELVQLQSNLHRRGNENDDQMKDWDLSLTLYICTHLDLDEAPINFIDLVEMCHLYYLRA